MFLLEFYRALMRANVRKFALKVTFLSKNSVKVVPFGAASCHDTQVDQPLETGASHCYWSELNQLS